MERNRMIWDKRNSDWVATCEELLITCREETERVRRSRTDEFMLKRKKNLPTLNQLSSQIRTLQDKVNVLSEEKELYDPETASSSGMSHVPSQSPRTPSPRCTLGLDSGLPHYRNSMDISGNVFESLFAQERISPSIPSNSNKDLADEYCEGVPRVAMRHGEGLRREPQSSTKPTPRFSRYLVFCASSWSNFCSKLYDGNSEVCFLGIAFRTIPRPG